MNIFDDLKGRFTKESAFVGRLYFMYAGHGLEDDEDAYLAPHDAEIDRMIWEDYRFAMLHHSGLQRRYSRRRPQETSQTPQDVTRRRLKIAQDNINLASSTL